MKVLLISPKFFGYERQIYNEINGRGNQVAYVNSDPQGLLMTVTATLKKFHLPYRWLIHCFESRCDAKIKDKTFDRIIVICGWAITSTLVRKLRSSNLNKGGKMVLYYWDSITLLGDDPERLRFFDNVYSFDRKDCDNSKGRIVFLPLFYTSEYHPLDEIFPHNYNLMTVGSYKWNRYQLIERLKSENHDISIFSFMYISRWLFEFHKMFRPKMKNVKREKLSFEKMTQKEILDVYRKCDAVLDIPKTGQNGLTIRTFECLAMNKKIVTTNPSIINYDFYNPSNIYILDFENLSLPSKEWFNKPYLKLSDNIVIQYSIKNWLNVILQ